MLWNGCYGNNNSCRMCGIHKHCGWLLIVNWSVSQHNRKYSFALNSRDVLPFHSFKFQNEHCLLSLVKSTSIFMLRVHCMQCVVGWRIQNKLRCCYYNVLRCVVVRSVSGWLAFGIHSCYQSHQRHSELWQIFDLLGDSPKKFISINHHLTVLYLNYD